MSYTHSYNEILMHTPTQRCHFEWHWVTQQNSQWHEASHSPLQQLSFLCIFVSYSLELILYRRAVVCCHWSLISGYHDHLLRWVTNCVPTQRNWQFRCHDSHVHRQLWIWSEEDIQWLAGLKLQMVILCLHELCTAEAAVFSLCLVVCPVVLGVFNSSPVE